MRAKAYCAHLSIHGHWALRCMSRCPDKVISLNETPMFSAQLRCRPLHLTMVVENRVAERSVAKSPHVALYNDAINEFRTSDWLIVNIHCSLTLSRITILKWSDVHVALPHHTNGKVQRRPT
ncbi:hypothetical protein TNCV_878491 [Trichonephila clavipes]|nr:hypothetical protein TNCV_878491 [Trichonephila clavipes]